MWYEPTMTSAHQPLGHSSPANAVSPLTGNVLAAAATHRVRTKVLRTSGRRLEPQHVSVRLVRTDIEKAIGRRPDVADARVLIVEQFFLVHHVAERVEMHAAQ